MCVPSLSGNEHHARIGNVKSNILKELRISIRGEKNGCFINGSLLHAGHEAAWYGITIMHARVNKKAG